MPPPEARGHCRPALGPYSKGLGLGSGFESPDLDRPGRQPHQLCEHSPDCADCASRTVRAEGGQGLFELRLMKRTKFVCQTFFFPSQTSSVESRHQNGARCVVLAPPGAGSAWERTADLGLPAAAERALDGRHLSDHPGQRLCGRIEHVPLWGCADCSRRGDVLDTGPARHPRSEPLQSAGAKWLRLLSLGIPGTQCCASVRQQVCGSRVYGASVRDADSVCHTSHERDRSSGPGSLGQCRQGLCGGLWSSLHNPASRSLCMRAVVLGTCSVTRDK